MATVTAPILLDSTGQQIKAALEEVSILPQIVDNLTTSDATKALSAKQGKVLNEKINAINSDTGWQNAGNGVWYRKINKIIYVTGSSYGSIGLNNGWTTIVTLPDTCTSPVDIFISVNAIGGTDRLFGILQGNVIKIYDIDSGTSYWAFSFNYVADM